MVVGTSDLLFTPRVRTPEAWSGSAVPADLGRRAYPSPPPVKFSLPATLDYGRGLPTGNGFGAAPGTVASTGRTARNSAPPRPPSAANASEGRGSSAITTGRRRSSLTDPSQLTD
jgi:hypothetical protein